jgi:hypothetical protein
MKNCAHRGLLQDTLTGGALDEMSGAAMLRDFTWRQ